MFEALLSLYLLFASTSLSEVPKAVPPHIDTAAAEFQVKGKDGVIFSRADLAKNPNIVIVGDGYALFDRDPEIWGDPVIDKSEGSAGFGCVGKNCAQGFDLDISKVAYSDAGKTLTHKQWLHAMAIIGPQTKPIVTGKTSVTFPKHARVVIASREKAALIESRVESANGETWSGFSLNFPREAFYVRVAVTGPVKLRDKVRAKLFETVRRVKVP